MSLIESLLGAILRLDGDSLVLHTGEKPYVVTSSSAMNAFRGPLAWGQVELSTRALTSGALLSMIDQLLTSEQHRVLDELGAVENELPGTDERPAFTVIAARGGDDIWVEIRPVRPKAVPEPVAEPEPDPQPEMAAPPAAVPSAPVPQPSMTAVPGANEHPLIEPQVVVFAGPKRTPEFAAAEEELEPEEELLTPSAGAPPPFELVHEVPQEQPDEQEVMQLLASSGLLARQAPPGMEEQAEADAFELRAETDGAPGDSVTEFEEIRFEPAAAPAPTPAVVLPLARTIREQQPVAPVMAASPDIDRLLRIAVARGASGLYLVAQSRPTLRVDGDMQQLDGEEPLSAAAVEALMLALAPEPTRDAIRSGEPSEWFREVADIGRVRCLSFRDHRGPGVIVRLLPARAVSVDQLGLSRDIQALCNHPDGLVLVAGPRASGKSTLVSAFVDLINRTRSDHVITIERQVTFVHESRRSFVSQREVRGESHEIAAALRGALREDPDVVVVEELRSAEVIAAALEAAESGRLVLAGLRAPGAAQALERLVGQVPAERRAHALEALSTSLRGVVAQVLLRKSGGGRVAARELLVSTPAAASVIAEGKLFQLSAALESGRKLGSVSLNETLTALIRDGVADSGDAWRKAYDRDGLLVLLKREGIDTSFVERLA